MRLRLEGKRVVFAPGAIAYDEAFQDGKEFSRKARTLAGNYQLLRMLPQLLVPFRNPSWFELVSHKVCRLLCPWAMLLLVMSSMSLLLSSSDWKVLAIFLVAGQLGFYVLAILGSRFGKLGSIARTFVVMNAAALVGFWRFLSQSQKVTW